jgi:hypothetical protein
MKLGSFENFIVKDMSGTAHILEVSIQGSVIGDNNPAFENQRIIQKVYSCSFCD